MCAPEESLAQAHAESASCAGGGCCCCRSLRGARYAHAQCACCAVVCMCACGYV